MEQKRTLTARQPIAIVRLDDLSQAARIAAALHAGGIRALEFTLTNREALKAIGAAREAVPGEVLVGVGTVLTAADAREALAAGAEFLVTPILEPEVITVGVRAGIPVVSGAFTPTEIVMATRAGAEYVKVFPARSGGPAYIKDILAPLPHLKLVPTGGVNLDNCTTFLAAGAYTVGLGSNLVDPKLIVQRDWDGLTEVARKYVAACEA